MRKKHLLTIMGCVSAAFLSPAYAFDLGKLLDKGALPSKNDSAVEQLRKSADALEQGQKTLGQAKEVVEKPGAALDAAAGEAEKQLRQRAPGAVQDAQRAQDALRNPQGAADAAASAARQRLQGQLPQGGNVLLDPNAAGSGGLLGVGESMGLIDKKTSGLLRQGVDAANAFQPIEFKEEKEIGAALALEVFNRFGGAYENPKLQRYVSLVGYSVARLSDRADIDYYFGILNSEVPNALSAPGGYVFVSVGLLRLLKNEAQLAGVLGHEIAHISKKHALQTLQRGRAMQSLGAITFSAMQKDPSKFNSLMSEVSDLLFTKGLDKELEYEADKTGTDFAARVGYQAGGLKDVMNILGGAGPGQESLLFSTHPAPRDRYRELIRHLSQAKSSGGQVLLERFTEAARNLP